jgi:hypothetical protein
MTVGSFVARVPAFGHDAYEIRKRCDTCSEAGGEDLIIYCNTIASSSPGRLSCWVDGKSLRTTVQGRDLRVV